MKYIKYIVRPIALFLIFGGLATIQGIRQVMAAEDTQEEGSTMPEVLVRGKGDKKSYKPKSVSSTKYGGSLLDAPQTINVINEDLMEDQNVTSLRDALRNVPGISMQAGEGGVPAGDSLSIRGFNARTDLFVDGIRDFGGYTRDSFNFEQIEVVKGPTSNNAGRGSTGGFVNMITKMPKLDTFYNGSVGFGSAFYKRTTVDFNQEIKPVNGVGIPGTAVRFNGVWHDADVAGRDEVQERRWGVAPSIAFGLDTPARLEFAYLHLEQDNVPSYGIPWVPTANAFNNLAGYAEQPAPVHWSNFYGLTERDYERTVTDVYTVIGEYDITDDIGLRNIFRYGRTARDSVITAPRFPAAPGLSSTVLTRQLQPRDMLDTIVANQTDATFRFDTGPVGHMLVTGVEYSAEGSENRIRAGGNTVPADLYDPEPGQSVLLNSPIDLTGARNTADADSVGLFVVDTAKFFQERLELIGGLRWDYFDLDFTQRAANNTDVFLDRTDKNFSYQGGVVVHPIPTGSVYFGYSTSFNPSTEGLAASSAANSAANVAFDPEQNRAYELGTKWDFFEERLSVSGAIFRNTKTNARTTDPGTNPASTADDVVVQEGTQRVLGAELGVTGGLTEHWDMYAAYTVLNGEITESVNPAEVGNEVPNAPDHSLNVWTAYQLPYDIEVGTGIRFIDARYSAVNNLRKAPGYWIWDAMLAKTFRDHITFRVNFYNLTDQEYIEQVGGGHFVPGAGRSMTFTTDFQF